MSAGTAAWEETGLCPYGIVRWNGIAQFNGLLWLKGVVLLWDLASEAKLRFSPQFPVPHSHLTYMLPVAPLEVTQLPLWLQSELIQLTEPAAN